MKRSEFLKSVLTLSGGLTVVSCSPMLIDDILPKDVVQGDISIGDAKKWFNEIYLKRFQGGEGARTKFTRKCKWEGASKPTNRKTNKEFGWIWVPIEYETNERPGVVIYTDETKYKLELKELYQQPIMEAMIFVNINGENVGFLAQVAVDPFEIANNDYIIDKSVFTGTILKTEWNNSLIEGTTFIKGEIDKIIFNSQNQLSGANENGLENARVQDCYYYSVYYTSWYVDSDGVFTLVGHTQWASVCNGTGGGWGDSGGGNSGGGGDVSQGGTGGGVYWDPLVSSGGGSTEGWVYPPSALYNFNFQAAAENGGTDRLNMSVNVTKTINILGLTNSLASFSYDKALALARSIGGVQATELQLLSHLGKRIGLVSTVVSSVQVVIGLADGEFTWDEDGMNSVNLALGITTTFLIGATAPVWIVPTIGVVSCGMAVYSIWEMD